MPLHSGRRTLFGKHLRRSDLNFQEGELGTSHLVLLLPPCLRFRRACVHVVARIVRCADDSFCSQQPQNFPKDFLLRIAEKSGRNLRKAILMFEACKAQQYPFRADQQIHLAEWETFIATMAKDIVTVQSPARLKEVCVSLILVPLRKPPCR